MRYCFAALYVLIAGPVFADDGFIDLVQKLEKQNAAKVKAPCGCASPCPCAAGECGSAACPTAAQPTRAKPAGDGWQWEPSEGGYYWRWRTPVDAGGCATEAYSPLDSFSPFNSAAPMRGGLFRGRRGGGCASGS